MSMVALFVMGCNKKTEENALVINPNDAIDVRFEDVATDVRIVPLKGDDPVGGCYYLQCTGDEVMFLDNTYQKVYYFKNGSYQSTLNSVGRGAGEYTSISRICYDADNNVLYVRANEKNDAILKYSVPDMKYQGALRAPYPIESMT